MKKYFKILLCCCAVVLLFFILTPSYSMATDTYGPPSPTSGIIPDEGKLETGNYQLNDIMKIGINVTQWILGIVGSLALLMFVYGGFMFLLSGGSNERVEKGKQILIGAIIGLFIVFASYTIIGFVFSSLGIENNNWASSDWFK